MKRVLLCGTSLLIAGLQASLGNAPGLDLQRIESQPERIRARIEAWQPDVLVLEAQVLKDGFPLALLHDFPHLKLIGLDIEDNRLLLLSGSTAEKPTTEELLNVITGQFENQSIETQRRLK